MGELLPRTGFTREYLAARAKLEADDVLQLWCLDARPLVRKAARAELRRRDVKPRGRRPFRR